MKRLVYVAGALALIVTLAVPSTVVAGAKITFKYPKKLDTTSLVARAVPGIPIDPSTMDVTYYVMNDYGLVFIETLLASRLEPNSSGTRWTYRRKKDGTPAISLAQISERLNKRTGDLEYLMKFKSETDASAADPARVPGLTEAAARHIYVQVSIGPFNFFVQKVWDRVPANTDKPVKGWKITDKYMQL